MGQIAVPRKYWQLALDEISLGGWGTEVSIAIADEDGDLQLKTKPAPFFLSPFLFSHRR